MNHFYFRMDVTYQMGTTGIDWYCKTLTQCRMYRELWEIEISKCLTKMFLHILFACKLMVSPLWRHSLRAKPDAMTKASLSCSYSNVIFFLIQNMSQYRYRWLNIRIEMWLMLWLRGFELGFPWGILFL